MGSRVSKPAVQEILNKYLDEELANKIFWEICDKDEEEQINAVGMTVKEWKERNDCDYKIVWADDTQAGFGARGDSVYGASDHLIICCIERRGAKKECVLQVWSEALESDKAFIKAAMEEHERRVKSHGKI